MMATNSFLRRFADGVWIAEGPSVRFTIVLFPTRMIVVKLRDGSLWINSPVPVSSETLEQIVAIGPIRFLVAPTPLHVWRLLWWHARFPEAQLWGPPKVPREFSNLRFAGLLQDDPPAAWAEDIRQVVFKGNALIQEVEFLHKASRTLIMADLIQNYPPVNGAIVGNVAKALGGVLNGGVSRDARWTFTNKKAARASLETILSWNFDKMIVAHGTCTDRDAKAVVEAAFRWLAERTT